jgi:methionine biosynthesis protein MetW
VDGRRGRGASRACGDRRIDCSVEPAAARRYYDPYWAGGGPENQLAAELHGLLARYATSKSACLDVGCGDGRAAGLWLHEHAGEYVGVDVSTTGVAAARGLGLDARVVEDAASLPFPADSFDLAVASEVLEHLFDPSLAVAEVRRVLRPGGVLVVTVPNVAYWRRRVDLLVFGRWHPLGDELSVERPWRDPHLRFFTLDALVRLFESERLEVVERGAYGGALLRDVPVARRLSRGRPSAAYRRAERLRPSLLGFRLYVVGRTMCASAP